MTDLEAHIRRQMAFSRATFGPGERRKGVIDHIRKELDEIEAGDGDPKEWVDVVILALDGLWRSLHFGKNVSWPNVPGTADYLIIGKQSRNEQREWPDWRTADPEKAIEHVRGADG
jgi:hypothetical protein